MTAREAHDLAHFVKAEAARLGLDAVGITHPAGIASAAPRLMQFLSEGCHGDMTWMAANAERRADPAVLWPDARSIVMLGLSYAPEHDPLAVLAEKDRAAISVYAQGRDYHDVLKAKIRILAGALAARAQADVKIFVDTAPLMEKPLGQAAGIGWQGKHTNLVSRTHGSWLFLGAILTTAEITPDAPEADHCGSCSRCLDACPTNAFPAPYRLDARRCLAYLAIEYKGHIGREFREPLGNRVFGCDDCLAVCPWNKFAAASREAKFASREGAANPPLGEILALDDAAFRARFAGTPVKRTGRDRVVRNALIAAGNSCNPDHLPHIVTLLEDASPLVRAMAIWALSRLVARDAVMRYHAQFAHLETDEAAQDEWRQAAQQDMNERHA